MIRVHPVEYVIEIQNQGKSEGLLCAEGFEVRVCNEGCGPFLSIKSRNLSPTVEFDSHTVTLNEMSIKPLFEALDSIMQTANGDGSVFDEAD